MVASSREGCYALRIGSRWRKGAFVPDGGTIHSNCQEVHDVSKSLDQKRPLLGLGLLATFFLAGAVADELKVGDKAPAFSLEASDGKTYTLEQFKGKSAVVVAWFPKAFHRRLHQGMQVAS